MNMPTVQNRPVVLWDMDGTIVDTEGLWFDAHRDVVGLFGGCWTRSDEETIAGAGPVEEAAVLQQAGVRLGAEATLAWINHRVVRALEHQIPWRPGALSLLRELHDTEHLLGLVTMAFSTIVDTIVCGLGFDPFKVIVSGGDVEAGKPDPAAYLQATKLLGRPSESCLAIEDSRRGMTSALVAGMVVVGVPNDGCVEDLPAHVVWPTLVGRTAKDISSVFQHARRTRLNVPTSIVVDSTDRAFAGSS